MIHDTIPSDLIFIEQGIVNESRCTLRLTVATGNHLTRLSYSNIKRHLCCDFQLTYGEIVFNISYLALI